MSSCLITHIKQLVNVREQTQLLHGKAMAELPCLEDAYVRIEDDTITDYGSMSSLEMSKHPADHVIDATGQLVLPCWCDSHTHVVFAGSREGEFVDKLKGLSYA